MSVIARGADGEKAGMRRIGEGPMVETHELVCDDGTLVERSGDFNRGPLGGVELGEEGLDVERFCDGDFAGG